MKEFYISRRRRWVSLVVASLCWCVALSIPCSGLAATGPAPERVTPRAVGVDRSSALPSLRPRSVYGVLRPVALTPVRPGEVRDRSRGRDGQHPLLVPTLVVGAVVLTTVSLFVGSWGGLALAATGFAAATLARIRSRRTSSPKLLKVLSVVVGVVAGIVVGGHIAGLIVN